jgi:N-acetylglucosamine kinase-like BadF-type ATPase
MPSAYLGVDAGNSKTVALVCLASGAVVGAGRSGCGDIYGAVTEEAAVAEVFAAIDAALDQSGLDRGDIAAGAFRLAGIDWPIDREYWEQALDREWPSLPRRSILNDGYAAIRCGEPSGVGVAVAAGTSAAIAARGPDGGLWDMSWWGQHAMGALGLVSEAVRAVFLADLGLAPPTALTKELLAFYGRDDLAELNEWFTRRHDRATQPERVAAARTVTAVAAQGDGVARAIVDEQGRRLALYAEVAARKVGLTDRPEPVPVVLTGSVLTAPDSPVAEAMHRHAAVLLAGARLHVGALPPAAGAALDAIAEADQPVDENTLEKLGATAPSPEFLAT